MLYIGVVANTHGIKGEVKILSNFSTNDIFNVGNILYINDTPLKISSYRIHKNFHMVTFEGITDINEVLKYKGEGVFVDRKSIKDFVIEDLIGYEVYTNKIVGKVEYLLTNTKYPILVTNNKDMIPYIPNFIDKIDNDEKRIYINEIEGLIHEN